MFSPSPHRPARAAAPAAFTSCCVWLAFAGCSPSAGFPEVRSTVKERAGADVRLWQDAARSPAAAQVKELLAKPLGERQAVQIALWNNPELQAAFDELGVARADLIAASKLPNPELEGWMAFADGERPELGFAITEDLSQLLFLPYRNDVAETVLEAERVRASGAALDLVFTVRAAFFEYQAAEQTRELFGTALAASEAAVAIAERLFAAGNITQLDLDNERAFCEEARVRLAGAEINAQNQREALNRLLGLHGAPAQRWTLAGRLEPSAEEVPALAELERRAVERSLELRELALRGRAEGDRADLARLHGILPRLRAGVEAEREEHWEFGPVVGIELPLFDQGQGETERALARQRQAVRRREAHGVALRAAVRAARNQLVIAGRTVAQYRDVLLPMRARILDQTLRQYNAMQLGVFELLAAKREQVQTGRDYVAALRDYWLSRAALDSLLAGRMRRMPQLGAGMAAAAAHGMEAAGLGADAAGGH